MTDERIDLLRARCARARTRMAPEYPWVLLDGLEEALDELERWRPRQARMEVAA